ncbi:MAG TPA: GH1 family beta-glucosidase [Sedimentisphaerales bacterium]|nr:GH1 family beta-glucosidase [Sedimentisphaerales bacterium]
MGFPKGFVWGVAAASYQIEGAAYEDGKGLSVWDMMCRRKDAIRWGHTGEIACDHYYRYREDVALMASLGTKAYRLSVAWPRVLPDGIGRVSEKGLEFYDRLIDELLAHRIAPYVTLFHWDFPYELYCKGGWLNPSSSGWFAEYAHILGRRLGDRVAAWMTHNEPQCFVGLGHKEGKHAPGDKLGEAEVLRVAHNVLLAHGKAVQALRATTRAPIGYAPAGMVKMPAGSRKQDIDAARAATFAVTPGSLWNNTWWLDPVFLGRYPQDGLEAYGRNVPQYAESDMSTICQPLDFFGVNIYHGDYVEMAPDGKTRQVPRAPGSPMTAFDWSVSPESLYWGPKFFHERYKLPVYITENGMANCDWVTTDEQVHDTQRIDFLRRYLMQLQRAVDDGVDVRGYFLWSIMDNFEWAEGYTKRFGIVHVDFESQKRTPKDSAKWYKKLIAANKVE